MVEIVTEQFGSLYFCKMTGRQFDLIEALNKDDGIPHMERAARTIEILARNNDRTPRFSEADRDRLYDLPVDELDRLAGAAFDASGLDQTPASAKKN